MHHPQADEQLPGDVLRALAGAGEGADTDEGKVGAHHPQADEQLSSDVLRALAGAGEGADTDEGKVSSDRSFADIPPRSLFLQTLE